MGFFPQSDRLRFTSYGPRAWFRASQTHSSLLPPLSTCPLQLLPLSCLLAPSYYQAQICSSSSCFWSQAQNTGKFCPLCGQSTLLPLLHGPAKGHIEGTKPKHCLTVRRVGGKKAAGGRSRRVKGKGKWAAWRPLPPPQLLLSFLQQWWEEQI